MTFAGIRESGEKDSEKARHYYRPWRAFKMVCGDKSIIQSFHAGHPHYFLSAWQNRVSFVVLEFVWLIFH